MKEAKARAAEKRRAKAGITDAAAAAVASLGDVIATDAPTDVHLEWIKPMPFIESRHKQPRSYSTEIKNRKARKRRNKDLTLKRQHKIAVQRRKAAKHK